MFITLGAHYFRLRKMIGRLKRENPARRIVAIDLTEHLGDIIACEPVASYVQQCYPHAHVIWFVRRLYKDLIAYNPNIDTAFPIYCISEWIYLSRTTLFDEIVDLHFEGRICPQCQAPLRKHHGNTEITGENYYSYGNLLSAFCQSAGLPVLDDGPQMYIPDSVVTSVDQLNLPNRFIVVHCASNEVSRDWTTSNWQALLALLSTQWSIPVIEVGQRAVVTDTKSANCIDLCGQLSILQSAEVIRRARLFIGVDSGPAQMANAVGTPGVVLLGHYRAFTRYLPYSGGYASGELAELVYANGPLAMLPPDKVYDAVERQLRIHLGDPQQPSDGAGSPDAMK